MRSLRKWLAPFARLVYALTIHPRQIFLALVDLPRFFRDSRAYRRQQGANTKFPYRFWQIWPCLTDYHDSSGVAEGHYFHQDLLVARRIFQHKPARHVDIGSRVDGFIAHLLTFREVDYVDIRPLNSTTSGLHFIQSDATELAEFKTGSLESISTLHAAEHFGLGRYGDPVDPESCFRYMKALMRVLAPGGRLYFSVPVGVERVEFNAHRVFSPSTILETFRELRLDRFCAVMDDGRLYLDVEPQIAANERYGCGIFEFIK